MMKTTPQGRLVRCGVYTRVSTDDQARGEYSSLNAQRDICEHYISVHKMDGWFAAKHYEDGGFSGKDMERPGVQTLMSDIESGKIDVVVAYKIDRITRSLPDFYEFWRKLERFKVQFVSATQNFDTGTPMGMLMLNMLLSFAQFERELTSERTAHKLGERAKRGKWNGGWVPIGYEYDKTTQHLGLHPEEAAIIKNVYELAKTLKNATAVAREMNKQGLRTRKRVLIRRDGTQRVVGEKRFIGERITAIVTNPLYKGTIRHGEAEYDAAHPPIVSEQLWQEANKALRPEHRQWVQRRDKHVHLLKGLLKCGHCGFSLTPYPAGKKDQNGNPYLYYTCTNVTKEGSEATCPVRSLPARAFEDLIIGYISEIGRHPDIIRRTVSTSNREKMKSVRPLRSQLAEREKRLKELTEAVATCIEAAKAKGAANISADFLAEADKLAKEKREVEMEVEKLRIDIGHRERVVADEGIIADALVRFGDVMKNLSPDDQKDMVQLIVKDIKVWSLPGPGGENREQKHGQDAAGNVNPDEAKPFAEADQPGVFKTRIRTKWYRVNVTIHASRVMAEVFGKAMPLT
jgi:site-specific DNA recombinase